MNSQTQSQNNPQTNNDDNSAKARRLLHLAEARSTAHARRINPRERSAQKTSAALTWIFPWEWCAPATPDVVVHDTRGGHAQRLKRAGLVHITEVIGSPGTGYRPRHAVRLSSVGVDRSAEAITIESSLRDSVKTGVRAVPQHQIEHDHRLELLVLEWLYFGMIENYATPAELTFRSHAEERNQTFLCGAA
jgi:hypothetical protein